MAEKDTKLVVVEAFDNYRRGDEIVDVKIIDTVLKDHAEKVHVIPNVAKKEEK